MDIYNRKRLSKKEKEEIDIMFFGPYKKEWHDEDGIVDNNTTTIADRLELDKRLVSNYITQKVDRHFRFINKLRDVQREIEV